MKYIKTYEGNNRANIGDYVIINTTNSTGNKELIDFISNNVGRVVNRDYYTNPKDNLIVVKYMKIPNDILMFFNDRIRRYYEPSILYFSKSKAELERKLIANKYNL